MTGPEPQSWMAAACPCESVLANLSRKFAAAVHSAGGLPRRPRDRRRGVVVKDTCQWCGERWALSVAAARRPPGQERRHEIERRTNRSTEE